MRMLILAQAVGEQNPGIPGIRFFENELAAIQGGEDPKKLLAVEDFLVKWPVDLGDFPDQTTRDAMVADMEKKLAAQAIEDQAGSTRDQRERDLKLFSPGNHLYDEAKAIEDQIIALGVRAS